MWLFSIANISVLPSCLLSFLLAHLPKTSNPRHLKSSARELPAYPTPCPPSSHSSGALVMKSAPHCALFLTLSTCGRKTCFPYCHHWGYCNGLITSFPLPSLSKAAQSGSSASSSSCPPRPLYPRVPPFSPHQLRLRNACSASPVHYLVRGAVWRAAAAEHRWQ